jgi:hypothetical protein
MPVHRLDAVQQRNAEPSLGRLCLIHLVHRTPVIKTARRRIRAAITQKRSHHVLANVVRPVQKLLIRLRHLADLFVERHPRQRLVEPVVKRNVGGLTGRASVAGLPIRRPIAKETR